MAKESGNRRFSLEKNSATNSTASTKTIKSTDRDASFGPWEINIRVITRMMKGTVGVLCSGSMGVFTKGSGCKVFSRA